MENTMEEYELNNIIFKHKCALDILYNKLTITNKEFIQEGECNPIEYIKARIKTKNSIYNKLVTDGYDVNIDNVLDNIHDIAGIRVVCSFLSDIERIENIINNYQDIKVINRKDYINHPKASGYRSLHLLVLVPVQFRDSIENIEVEIQLRTIAMDMWASTEHKLCYKNNYMLTEKKISNASTFAQMVEKMDKLLNNMVIRCNTNDEFVVPEVNDKEGLEQIKSTSMLKYNLAKNTITTKIHNIYNIFKESNSINPIEHVKSRIKPAVSICQKLEKRNYNINLYNMENHVHDLVGIRIVCSFLSDLDIVRNIIESDDDIKIISVKDYVNNPKDNGYRSYHMNVLVPVKMLDKTELVEVEIQLRTIAMDMWASLEHKMCYKRIGEEPEEVRKSLQNVSNIVSEYDKKIDDFVKENMKNYTEVKQPKKTKKLIPLNN